MTLKVAAVQVIEDQGEIKAEQVGNFMTLLNFAFLTIGLDNGQVMILFILAFGSDNPGKHIVVSPPFIAITVLL